jgi:hypothetical protein
LADLIRQQRRLATAATAARVSAASRELERLEAQFGGTARVGAGCD